MGKLMIRGGYGEHGRSCFLVEYGTEGRLYMVDCGILDTDPFPYPHVTGEELERVDYLFLTHCHKDHSGAFEYFCKHGFSGTLVTTAMSYLLAGISYEKTEFLTVKENGEHEKAFGLLHVVYGRSGHCPGGLWFEIREQHGTILFSGDYQENTLVYRCDPIRNRKARLALIDCAHRETEMDAEELREQLVCAVFKKMENGQRIILPVPQYGRGLEMWLLMKDRFPNARIYVDEDFAVYAERMLSEQVWYYGHAYQRIQDGFFDVLKVEEEESRADDYDILILADTHLKKQKNAAFVHRAMETGAAVLINGRVKTDGPVGKLLADGKAERFLFPHHQSYGDLKRVASKNEFAVILPFHNHEKEVL